MNRRQLLKAGMVGGILLAAGGAWIAWRDLRAADDGDPARDRIASIVGALAPVILAGMLPSDSAERSAGIARVVAGVRSVILEFPDAVQQEIADLFRTLDIRFARRILTGIADEWPDATHADIAAFLERWRVSRSGLLQSGYFALHDLVFGAWYSAPVTWAAIGYPGPPNVE